MSVATLSAAEKQRALQKYDEMREREQFSGQAQNDFIASTKAQLLFQHNWAELLGAAPLSLNLIGACYIACSVSRATTITLDKPTSGEFKYLRWDSLRANMIEMGDIGMRAFQETAPRMDGIANSSRKLGEEVNTVTKCLLQGPEAAQQLKLSLANIKRMAQDCSKKASDIDQDFSNWLAYIEELHYACVAKETSNEKQRVYNGTQYASKVAQQAAGKDAVEGAKKAMDELGETLKTTREAYKKASDEFPKGWDVVGQQFVAGLGQTFNNALNACIPALVAKLNPVAAAGQAVNIFKDAKTPDGKPADVEAKGPVQQQANVLPPDYNDPAYKTVGRISIHASLLLSMLSGGKDRGIDWEAVVPKAGEKQQGSGYCLNMLDFENKQFKSSGKTPSLKFVAALKSALEVAKALDTAAQDKTKMGAKEVDATTIQGWQKKAQDAVNDFAVLQSSADSFAGIAPPVINPNDLIQSQSAAGSIANAILDKASERIQITQKTLTASMDSYQKASATYVEIARVQAEIAGELVRLADEKIGLAEIKAILTKCVEALVQLKAQVRKLVAYFSAMAQMIDWVQQNEVSQFANQVDSVAGGPTNSVGGFQVIDITRQIIFNSAILIRAYFSLFTDIARMWVKIHADHLQTGMSLLDALANETKEGEPGKPNEQMNKKISNLKKWSDDSKKQIADMANETKEKMLEGMSDRLKQAEKGVALLPPPVESTKQAIEQGKQEVVKAAETGLAEYQPLVTKSKFKDMSKFMASSDDSFV